MLHESENNKGVAVQRALVVGGAGSGKTTLARALATALEMPHHDLDRVAYAPPTDGFAVSVHGTSLVGTVNARRASRMAATHKTRYRRDR